MGQKFRSTGVFLVYHLSEGVRTGGSVSKMAYSQGCCHVNNIRQPECPHDMELAYPSASCPKERARRKLFI